jgi:hypothetical protein
MTVEAVAVAPAVAATCPLCHGADLLMTADALAAGATWRARTAARDQGQSETENLASFHSKGEKTAADVHNPGTIRLLFGEITGRVSRRDPDPAGDFDVPEPGRPPRAQELNSALYERDRLLRDDAAAVSRMLARPGAATFS